MDRLGALLRDNWVAVLGWLVFAGVAYGVHTTTLKWIDTRITQLEQVDTPQVRWQVQQTTSKVAQMEADGKVTQQQVSDIKAQLGVLSTKLDGQDKKLDMLIDLTKQRQHEK